MLRDGWIYNHVLYYQLMYLSKPIPPSFQPKQTHFHLINSSFRNHPISQIIAVNFLAPRLSRARYPLTFPNNKIYLLPYRQRRINKKTILRCNFAVLLMKLLMLTFSFRNISGYVFVLYLHLQGRRMTSTNATNNCMLLKVGLI
jgi:hypothetical protein